MKHATYYFNQCTVDPGGGGVLPYISYIGMCRPKGYGFWAVLVWRVQIWTIKVLNLVWFSTEPRERINTFVFQLQMNSRERKVSKIYHSSWILSILEFIIDAKFNYDTTKVWKWVCILESRSENGCEKWNILVWNWVRIWGTGRHTPTKNSEEYPPPPPPGVDQTVEQK